MTSNTTSVSADDDGDDTRDKNTSFVQQNPGGHVD